MYKSLHLHFSFITFDKANKKPPYTVMYSNGFKKWRSDSVNYYAFVIGTMRFTIGVKTESLSNQQKQ